MLFSGAESCQGLSRELLPVPCDHSVSFQQTFSPHNTFKAVSSTSLWKNLEPRKVRRKTGFSHFKAMIDLEAKQEGRRVQGFRSGPESWWRTRHEYLTVLASAVTARELSGERASE